MRQLARASPTRRFWRPAAVTFEPLPDHELQQLADEQLIAYIRDARDEGELAHGRRGLAILVYGYERDVKRRLSIKVPGARRRRPRPRRARQGDRRGVRRQLGRRVPQLAAHDRRPHRRRLLPARRAAPEGDDPAQRARRRGRRLGRRAVDRERGRRGRAADHRRGGARDVQRETPAGDRAARVRRAHRRRGLRQDRGNERGQRRPDRLALPRQAPRPARSRHRRRPMSDVDRLLADYIAEHRAGGEADPRAFLSRASPAERRRARRADRRLPRASAAAAVRPGELPRLERRAHRRRARARDRRPGRALARAAATTARPGRAEAQRARRAARRPRSASSDRKDKVAGYYHEMEQGLLPARGVSRPRARGARADRRRDRPGAPRRRARADARRRGPDAAPAAAFARRAYAEPAGAAVAGHPAAPRRASGTRSTSCSAAPDVRFRPRRRPSTGSTMSDAHDPAALVRHAVQAGDWRLVELIARMLSGQPRRAFPRRPARLRHARRETRPRAAVQATTHRG